MDTQLTGFPDGHHDSPATLCTQTNQFLALELLRGLSENLRARSQQTGYRKDLDLTIALQRLLVDICPHDSPDRWKFLHSLAISRFTRFERWKRCADLERAIVLQRDSIGLCPRDHEHHSALLENLAMFLRTRFDARAGIGDLNEAIELQRAAVSLLTEEHPRRTASLGNLAPLLAIRFGHIGNPKDLDESIDLFRIVLSLRPESHPDRPEALSNLSNSLKIRFGQTGSMDDLNEAVRLSREALALSACGQRYRPMSLNNLAASLQARFRLSGSMDDLNEAVQLLRDSLALHPHGDPCRPMSLNNLAGTLQNRYEQSGSVDDLDEAIRLLHEAVSLLPDKHPHRSASLNNLANSLCTRFERNGSMDDLDKAVGLGREALALRPHGHPERSTNLNNLATSLLARFMQSGSMDDLNEAVRLHRDSLALHPHGHPNRFTSLNNLAVSLHTRFEQSGSMDDLNEAVRLHHDALALYPHGHPDQSMSFRNLANSLRSRFRQSGNIEDLNEAVRLNRDSLALHPHGHPERPTALNNLGASLQTRFEQSEGMHDLNEAVQLYRDALALFPRGHWEWSMTLDNLAFSLQTRYERCGNVDDLNESVQLLREALALRPHGHPGRAVSLNNLANSLRSRSKQSGNLDDLDEAVRLHRDALALRPHGHLDRCMSLNDLAAVLRTRFEQNGSTDDLDEAVRLLRDALALLPPGDPARSKSLRNLAIGIWTRLEQSSLNEAVLPHRDSTALRPAGHPDRSVSAIGSAMGLYHPPQELDQAEDFEECVQLLAQAADHILSPTLIRLDAAFRWAKYARSRNHSTTLVAYRKAITLLQHLLTIRPDLADRHDLLNSKREYQRLGVDAASYAIENGGLSAAIEILEQGRAMLWSQMRGLRTPLDRLMEVNKPLAEKLRRVSSQLESLMTSSERRPTGSGLEGDSNSRRLDDERMERVRRLSEEQEVLIADIRKVPGFEDFMRSAPFEKLRQAATEGPVVVVNHSRFRCDALIILAREEEPCVCVPLDEAWCEDAARLAADLLGARYIHKVHSSEYDETLRQVMKVLWDRVVSKVVQKLDELGIAKGSRIWWCPTLFLSTLPFHAVGPYVDENGATKYLLDDYISSYAPTLTSLITARSGIHSKSEKLLFVGDTSLSGTKQERKNIRTHRLVEKSLLDESASRDSVTESLRKVQWVHFACHGKLDLENPFESSFALPGGELTLLDIAKANLPNAEFAFLSACHTAEQLPAAAFDEALHLAAAIQFCGFRSVVGTMWELLDQDGPILTDVVYCHLMNMEDGEVRFKGAAAAVREAALHLRQSQEEGSNGGKGKGIMAERWVNLVHIGA